jgi:hypothetical protein
VGGWFKNCQSFFSFRRKDERMTKFEGLQINLRNHILFLSDNRTLQPFSVNFNKEYDIL